MPRDMPEAHCGELIPPLVLHLEAILRSHDVRVDP